MDARRVARIGLGLCCLVALAFDQSEIVRLGVAVLASAGLIILSPKDSQKA